MKSTLQDLPECGNQVLLASPRDGLAAILLEDEKAVLNHVPHYAGLQAWMEPVAHPQHFDTPYRLACHKRQGPVVLWFSRVDRKHPGTVKWLCPIQPLH